MYNIQEFNAQLMMWCGVRNLSVTLFVFIYIFTDQIDYFVSFNIKLFLLIKKVLRQDKLLNAKYYNIISV